MKGVISTMKCTNIPMTTIEEVINTFRVQYDVEPHAFINYFNESAEGYPIKFYFDNMSYEDYRDNKDDPLYLQMYILAGICRDTFENKLLLINK